MLIVMFLQKQYYVQAFDVPPRIPNSCCPPLISGTIVVDASLYNNPLPFKPYILCAENEARSTSVINLLAIFLMLVPYQHAILF